MGRYYTVKGGARGMPVAPVTVEDIIAIKQNPKLRLTTSPFGLTEEDIREGRKMLYVGRAVPWKGVKGIEAVREINPDVAAGLEKAKAISQAAKGTKGVGVYKGRIMPLKCIKQIEIAEERKKRRA